MVIVRDGKVYELTAMEAWDIYRQMKREFLINDIKERAEENNIDLEGTDVGSIADKAERAIDKDDYFWDQYWSNIDYALEGI